MRMRSQQRKCIATKAGASLALLFAATFANAASIGTVTELDGNVLVSRANGSVKVLGVGSAIEQGDVLTSRSQTYVTLKLPDDSSVTLGPDTNLKLERYVFHNDTPDNDGALFALAKGSVRITTARLGTRSGDTFTIATPTSTVDIRRASVVLEYVPAARAQVAWNDAGLQDAGQPKMIAAGYMRDDASGFVRTSTNHANAWQLAQIVPQAPSGLTPGLYVQVLDGVINVSNAGGSQIFNPGQFGYTPNLQQPPIIVPQNPGLKFEPPPSFSTTTGPQTTGPSKGNAVDCIVR